ncbi:MAG: VUT family protein [Lachnospiraceae bacterium]|nr:VUT family protein [Lachnospiraceae bacterium]
MLKREWENTKVLLRNVPSPVITLFVVSVIVMNLLANKELFSAQYLALDCGFTVSWVSFLCMDILCKRFGAKASVRVSIYALCINLGVCLLFKLLSFTPGMWGEFYTTGMPEVNDALNATVGGSWYVVLGSSIAMLSSSCVNAFFNKTIAAHLKKDNFAAFAIRSYVSTGIAQFCDNLVFALLVSHVFFGWTWIQVFTCSITGAVMELLCEVFISPIGYRVVKQWEAEDVGREYLEFIEEQDEE